MAKCIRCGREMDSSDGCSVDTVAIDGKVFDRIRVGDPGDFDEGESKTIRCHDCNALYGHYHHWGCDAERCPVCGHQLISCDCGNATAWPAETTSEVRARPRVACYCRVAHPDQLALDKQMWLNRTFAREQGYDIVAAIAEYGTGTSMGRPGLLKLLERVEQCDIDVLIVKDLNRFGRNLSFVLPLLRSLQEKGVRVESPLMGAGVDLLKFLPILQDLREKEGVPDEVV